MTTMTTDQTPPPTDTTAKRPSRLATAIAIDNEVLTATLDARERIALSWEDCLSIVDALIHSIATRATVTPDVPLEDVLLGDTQHMIYCHLRNDAAALAHVADALARFENHSDIRRQEEARRG